MSNGVLSFNEEVCVCGRHVKGRLAGAMTRGSKQILKFECNVRDKGCGHRWQREGGGVSAPVAPSNGNGHGNGHEPVMTRCPNCNHEFEVSHG